MVFGLGESNKATVEILWPGGVRNRYYTSDINQILVLPEIPCSFNQQWDSYKLYQKCVKNSLHQLHGANIVSKSEVTKLFKSATRAFTEHWKTAGKN